MTAETDESIQRLASMHALIMTAISMADFGKDEACILGLGLLVDIIANCLPERTPELVAAELERLVEIKARFLRQAAPDFFRERAKDLH